MFLYADTVPRKPPPPCRCFYLVEMALESDGPARLIRTTEAWPGGASVQVPGLTLACCPMCGGAVGSWRDEVFVAHARFRAARANYNLTGGIEAILPQMARLKPIGTTYGAMRQWLDEENHLMVQMSHDPREEVWGAAAYFWPGPNLIASPFEAARPKRWW